MVKINILFIGDILKISDKECNVFTVLEFNLVIKSYLFIRTELSFCLFRVMFQNFNKNYLSFLKELYVFHTTRTHELSNLYAGTQFFYCSANAFAESITLHTINTKHGVCVCWVILSAKALAEQPHTFVHTSLNV